MKILVEVLDLEETEIISKQKTFRTNAQKTLEISTSKGIESSINDAITEAQKIKLALPKGRVRIIEYHNDEPDETRQPCKILYEL